MGKVKELWIEAENVGLSYMVHLARKDKCQNCGKTTWFADNFHDWRICSRHCYEALKEMNRDEHRWDP